MSHLCLFLWRNCRIMRQSWCLHETYSNLGLHEVSWSLKEQSLQFTSGSTCHPRLKRCSEKEKIGLVLWMQSVWSRVGLTVEYNSTGAVWINRTTSGEGTLCIRHEASLLCAAQWVGLPWRCLSVLSWLVLVEVYISDDVRAQVELHESTLNRPKHWCNTCWLQ